VRVSVRRVRGPAWSLLILALQSSVVRPVADYDGCCDYWLLVVMSLGYNSPAVPLAGADHVVLLLYSC